MKSTLKKLTSGLLSAGMLLTMMQPVLTASTVAAAASAADTFRTLVHNAWETKSTKAISTSSLRIPLDQAADLYYEMLYTEAKWFYVSSSFGYSSHTGFRTEYMDSITVQYIYDISEIDSMQQELDNTVSEILSGVQSGWSDAEKVLYLHDYLAEHCEYDLTYTYNDAYAALCGGTAVCQGYALAMCILCRELDIPCYPITSDTLKHMWNVVQIGGEWYQLDATYDDGAPDMLGRATHMYVLVNDAYMQADPYHAASDWNYFSEGTQITCTDAQYNNAFWYYVMDTMHPMVLCRGGESQ